MNDRHLTFSRWPRQLPLLLAMLLALTGCHGKSNDDDEQGGGGNTPVNVAPSVSAGGDRQANEFTTVSITGSASDNDGSIASFQWTQIGAPAVALSTAGTATVSFIAPSVSADTLITLRLTVTDNDGATASDDIVVTVRDISSGGSSNLAPTASAGLDRDVTESTAVSITGSGTDSDGSVASYLWTQEGGPAVTLNNAGTPTVSFDAPAVSTHTPITLRLTVTDDDGATGFDELVVTVRDVPVGSTNLAPSADAGDDRQADENSTVALAGSGSDSDGSIAGFSWLQQSGPAVTLTDANTAAPSFTAPATADETNLVFRLTVTDDDGATDSDVVGVTVRHATTPVVTGLAGACLSAGFPAALCGLLGTVETTVPDRLPVAALATSRGDLVKTPAASSAPSAKTIDGNPADWTGVPSRFGGTERLDAGEHIYSDYLFDAWGADDGVDTQRLDLLGPLADLVPRSFRVDQLFQAAGDQFGAPPPIGALDHYGDATNLDDEADLYELRWAAQGDDVYLLARFSTLTDSTRPALLVLLDTVEGSTAVNEVGFGSGLRTRRFEQAVLLTADGAQRRDLASGTVTSLTGAVVAVEKGADSAGARWRNTLEVRLPATLFAAAGSTRLTVVAGPRTVEGFKPANVAYRFDEPVAGVYNERSQALALQARDIDAFSTTISFRNLRRGVAENFELGPGYYERQFVSGENISRESSENGLLQRYGLYVPRNPARNPLNQTPLTIWMHYRGGKAHSGAAWTPRLITQLGEEQGNIIATPHARGTSTWYVSEAHQDFFEVFADVAGTAIAGNENLSAPVDIEPLLAIDPDRVYLSGYSMGGYSTYLFGLLYPDKFAAGFSTSGAVTQGAWTGLGPDDFICTLPGGEIPGVGDATSPCFVEANESNANAQLNYRMLENARHFPIIINHGSNDELALTPGALRMGLRLAELGYRHDMMIFLGYEHFTQAIIDEWADGAVYLNHFTRNVNPRQVTYKLLPALVNAVNTVTADGVDFNFNPDGAYWVDGLSVRDPDINNSQQFGLIEAESEALAGKAVLPIPRSGDNNPTAPVPQISTPVFSPGYHSTPYVRTGLDWLETADLPVRNAFNATLTRFATASFDVARMALDLNRRADGQVSTDGSLTLTLTQVTQPVRVVVNGVDHSDALQSQRIVLQLGPGLSEIVLQPDGSPTAFAPEAPTLAEACRALNIAPADLLCDQIDTVTAQLVAQCAALAAPGFCSTFGGNLHGLIEGCREVGGAQAGAICKLGDTVFQGLASGCRLYLTQGLPPEFCALLSGQFIGERDIANFAGSWVGQSLALQYEIGAPLRLVDALFPATHNSFNAAEANNPPTPSGLDSNQRYTSVDQLRMGVRALEVDVHWMLQPGSGGFGPTVCHGNAFHVGCTLERSLQAELADIRGWLDAHPDQVVILYLENNLNEPLDAPLAQLTGTEPYAAAAAAVRNTLGDILYTPADYASFLGSAFDCNGGHPLQASIATLRAADKRVLIHTEGCDAGWATLVFNKEAGNTHDQGPDDNQLQTFSVDGVCGGFDRATHESKWTRYFEDGTLVGALTGGFTDTVLGSFEDFRGMVRCGVNMPSMDHVTPSDVRLAAFIWSWAPGEPAVSVVKNCALQASDSRFHAADCAELYRVACGRRGNVDTDPAVELQWQLTPAAHRWAEAAAACATLPGGFSFDLPRNGYQNELLRIAREAAAADAVWLNYTDAQGDWLPAP